MTQFDQTNRWTLNKNTSQREGRSDADYAGRINVNGHEYWLNGWIKDGPNGKFISGTIKPKQDRTESVSQQALKKVYSPDRITSGPQKRSILPDDEGEIPF